MESNSRAQARTGAQVRALAKVTATAAAAAAAAVLGAATPALAQVQPPPQNVLNISASASTEVARDWLTVVFATTRESVDAAAVQGQLKQALDAALAEARKVARAGQVEVATGGFSLSPRYAARANAAPQISGWQGSAELVVEGRDVQAIAALTARITTLSIARTGFSLSREARQKVEDEVAAQAIERWRARADTMSRQFGFTGYQVREVAVNAEGGGMVAQPMVRAQAARMSAMEDSALPVEGGKATVTATVSGSVQMTR